MSALQLEPHASVVALCQAESAVVKDSVVGALQAQTTTTTRSAIWFALSDEFRAEAGTKVGLLLTRQASGDVRPLLDLRSVIALGLTIGVVTQALSWFARHRRQAAIHQRNQQIQMKS